MTNALQSSSRIKSSLQKQTNHQLCGAETTDKRLRHGQTLISSAHTADTDAE